MTPVYDVLSVQPNFDAGRVRRTQMKLAMAVGTSRHYRLDEITPRHFLQAAKLCDIPEKTATAVLEEVAQSADEAMDKVLSSMPKGFPEKRWHCRLSKVRNRALKRLAPLRIADLESGQEEGTSCRSLVRIREASLWRHHTTA